MKCECCGAEAAGNLARMCPPCFHSLAMYPMNGSRNEVTCSLHKRILLLSHDR